MKKISLIIICLFTLISAKAQKLPNVQNSGVKAPANVKIDGNVAEWGDKFSAYNPTTEVWYTIANDAENLYIVTSVTGRDMVNRIVAGGLSFIVPRSGQKNEKDHLVFTFPTYDTPDHKDNYKINIFPKGRVMPQFAGIETDNNKLLKNNVKFIGTAGVVGVDTLLSIYNTFNIQAACGFNENQDLVLEIAIPLKYLAGYITANKFFYRMLVNGGKFQTAKNMVVYFADGHQATEEDISKAVAQHNERQGRLAAPTEFLADYMLAK